MSRKRIDRIAQLQAQILEMKAEIEKLKTAPKTEFHYHFTPVPIINVRPSPWQPYIGPTSVPNWPNYTCGIINQNAETNRIQMLC